MIAKKSTFVTQQLNTRFIYAGTSVRIMNVFVISPIANFTTPFTHGKFSRTGITTSTILPAVQVRGFAHYSFQLPVGSPTHASPVH